MRTSIRITSGKSSAAASRASRVRGLPDDLDVVLGLEDHPEAGPDERLIVRDQDAHHQAASSSGSRARTTAPAAVARPALDHASVQRDALAHAREPVAAPRVAVAQPVVRDLELERVRLPVHRDPGVGRPCVLERVRQRLLDDAVGGEVDSRLQLARLPLDLELDREARGAAPSSSESIVPIPGCGANSGIEPRSTAVRPAAASR